MIGHLQTNKAAKTAELFRAVDSVDSLKLAEKLDAAARTLGKKLDVLIEINVGGEAAKSGVAPRFPGNSKTLLMAAPRLEALGLPRTNDRASIHRRSRGRASLLPQAARIARYDCRAQSASHRHGPAFHGHVARFRSRDRRRIDLRARGHGDLRGTSKNVICRRYKEQKP